MTVEVVRARAVRVGDRVQFEMTPTPQYPEPRTIRGRVVQVDVLAQWWAGDRTVWGRRVVVLDDDGGRRRSHRFWGDACCFRLVDDDEWPAAS